MSDVQKYNSRMNTRIIKRTCGKYPCVLADTVNLLPLLPTLHLVFTLLSYQWRRKEVGGQKGYMEYILVAGPRRRCTDR
jgi:hypothetical protein